MKNLLTKFAVGLIVILSLAGCQQQFQDIDSDYVVEQRVDDLEPVITNPDSITVYRNVDGFPNYAVLCINGDAIGLQSSANAASPVDLDDQVHCGAPAG